MSKGRNTLSRLIHWGNLPDDLGMRKAAVMRGSYPRLGAKASTNSYRRLDIRWIHRETRLTPGLRSGVTWSNKGTGRVTGSIGYAIPAAPEQAECIILLYSVNGEQVAERVPISWTACNYGGSRPWAHCPACHARVAVLYGGKRFLCRKCHGLNYSSTREDASTRGIVKAQAIRERLGGSANMSKPFPWKPKGMHWRTYWRLREEAEESYVKGMASLLDRLGHYLP